MDVSIGPTIKKVPKNSCFWTVVLEKTFESPLDCKEIKPVNPKGNQPWIFIGRTDAEAEVPIFWPPDVRANSLEKTDAGKDWRQEEKGTTEDEMVGWHHQLNGHEFEHTPSYSEGQRSLAHCHPWVSKNQMRLSNWTTEDNRRTTLFPEAFLERTGLGAGPLLIQEQISYRLV